MSKYFPISSSGDTLIAWRRANAARAVAELRPGEFVSGVIQRLWPNEAEAIQRAAVSPASTTGSGSQLSASVVGTYLKSLRPRSAAAQLFTNPLSLSERKQIILPAAAAGLPAAGFVGEGSPIPVVQANFTGVILGPPAKLAMMAGISGELATYSGDDATAIVSELMDDAAARGLDANVFSATGASASRPAGLLNGISAIAATTGGGVTAMVTDIKNLIGAIVAAGGGSSILIFAHPVQAVALNALAANGVGYPVIPAAALTAGTVVAVEQNAIASAFPMLPQLEASTDSTVHFEDSNPLAISTAGAPNAVAAPSRSAFQTNTLILRMVMPCTWVSRASGMVQYVTGATW
jgi:HK97 family phage major capsid protein